MLETTPPSYPPTSKHQPILLLFPLSNLPISLSNHLFPLPLQHGHLGWPCCTWFWIHVDRPMAPLQPCQAPRPPTQLLHLLPVVPHHLAPPPRAPPHHGRRRHLHGHGVRHRPRASPAFRPGWEHHLHHLHNFDHASISLSFLTYALEALLLDKLRPKLPAIEELTQLLAGLALGQQLLLFHLHSADHLLLQLLVLISLVTTLMGIGLQRSFVTSYVRSLSIFFQGFWFVLMGFILWTPALIPKGCRINSEEGHHVVRCDRDMALHRAKSLVHLQFCWCITAMAVFGVVFYVAMVAFYGEKSAYVIMNKEEEEEKEVDLELEKGRSEERRSFLEMSSPKTCSPRDMERCS